MKKHRMKVDPRLVVLASIGRIDPDLVDETTEEEIARQKAADEKEAMLDAARYARRIRKRLGLTQTEFSLRIGVSVDTIRNWEQGKRCPNGAALSLLKVLDKAPETALAALD
ncbi:MAG: helix-turn-helix domain-containing protein [Desulfotignum sp.]|nr:helix-turn-helix domain-containing protein [Desulfotignum sp.]MCF8090701.1 helix-turn-helix domain-containing protein [Desulfotignum sp.]